MQLSPVSPHRNTTIVIPDDRPVYRIKEGKFFGPDDRLYLEGEIIGWDEEPNLEMEPLNNLAREKFRSYIEKLDECGRAVSVKNGTGYTSIADAHENAMKMAQNDAKRVQLMSSPEIVPLMGGKKNRGPTVEKLEATQDTPLMGTPKKGKFSLNKTKDFIDGKGAVNKTHDGAV